MSILGRLLALTAGLILAIPAGALTLTVGIMLEPAARELIGALGLAGLAALVAELGHDGAPEIVAESLVLGVWTVATTLLVAPPSLVALVGEVAGTRSFAWYGGACGALTAAIPWLGRPDPGTAASGALGAEGRLTALLFLTGAVAGLVYWLVAGRSAGRAAVNAPASSGS